jgi:hypothetical protein
MFLVSLSDTPPAHTPAPWINAQNQIRDPQHNLIAELPSDALPSEQVEANASLIATAPLLLELARDYECTCIHRLGFPMPSSAK